MNRSVQVGLKYSGRDRIQTSNVYLSLKNKMQQLAKYIPIQHIILNTVL